MQLYFNVTYTLSLNSGPMFAVHFGVETYLTIRHVRTEGFKTNNGCNTDYCLS